MWKVAAHACHACRASAGKDSWWAVVDADSGEVLACHASEQAAHDHVRSLYDRAPLLRAWMALTKEERADAEKAALEWLDEWEGTDT